MRVTLHFYNAETSRYEEEEELSPELFHITSVGVGVLPDPMSCYQGTRNVGKINSLYTHSDGSVSVYVTPTFR